MSAHTTTLTATASAGAPDPLMDRLRREFSSDEQTLFLQSFEAYLQHDEADFVVSLDDVWVWMGFSEKGKGKRLLQQNFQEGTDYLCSENACSGGQATSGGAGGQNKQTIMMIVTTFKKLCMMARTKKAGQVHAYYIKMESVLMAHLKDQHLWQVAQLALANTRGDQLKLELAETISSAAIQQRRERSRALVDSFDMTTLTYAMHLKDMDDGSVLIKIGITGAATGIRRRMVGLKAEFGVTPTALDVYPCEMNYEFEQFLHQHPRVETYQYSESINGKVSTEVYRLPCMDVYTGIKRLMQASVSPYLRRDIRERELIVREKELIVREKELFVREKELPVESERIAAEQVKLRVLDKLPVEELPAAIALMYARETPGPAQKTAVPDDKPSVKPSVQPSVQPPQAASNGRVVRTYDVSDLTTHVQQFESMAMALHGMPSATRAKIEEAARCCTVYQNLRWQLVPCAQRDDPVAMHETVQRQKCREGFVAIMTTDGLRVSELFQTQAAVAERVRRAKGNVSTALKLGQRTGGELLRFWDDLEHDVQSEWLGKPGNALPEPVKSKRGKEVYRTDVSDASNVQKFASLQQLRSDTGVTTQVAKSSVRKNVPHGGWWYSFGAPRR